MSSTNEVRVPASPSLPGSARPFDAGDRAMLVDRKDRRYMVTLAPGDQWHSHAGTLDHDTLIGSPEGVVLRTSKNMEVTVWRPTRVDWMMKMRRGAQVVYPKDQARIVSVGDIRPGMTVVEAGAGSGALTMALLDAVGPTGRVISFERRHDHLEVAVDNVTTWYGEHPANWEVHEADAAEGIAEVAAHRVVLDLLEPWLVLPAARRALAPGGILVAYMPTITQVMRLDMACRQSGAFAHQETTESIVRDWDVANLAVRPAHRMVAHTAFLTTTRRVPPVDLGGPEPEEPPRGATVAFVDPPERDDEHDDGGRVGPAPGQLP